MQALENIRIADLSGYIAGAYCPTLLADLGAKVDKVEPFEGDAFRLLGAGFMGWNRGKRSIVIDLKKEEGRQVYYRMVERSQMVVENFRPGVSQRLGVEYETIRRIKLDIIYVRSLAHGSTGPYSTHPGFDPLLQARSGQMARQGGAGNPPVYYRVAVNDYMAAMASAFTAALALYVHARTGQGQEVESSLTNASIVAQSGEFMDYPGIPKAVEGGPYLKGLHPAWRLYQAGDTWLMIACAREEHWQALCRALRLEDVGRRLTLAQVAACSADDPELVSLIQDALSKKTGDVLAELEEAGVPCAPCLTGDEVMSDPHCEENDLFVEYDHPTVGRLRQTGAMIKLSETPGHPALPAPLLGQHTVEILQELGFSQEQIDDLLERKVVGQYGVNVGVIAEFEEDN